MRVYDYVIIGAGVSGVTFARLLQQSGVENFLLLERGDEPGGLCRSRQIDGHVLDTGGGHFLCTKHEEVYRFVFNHLPREAFNRFDRISKINIGGVHVDYPLESNIWQMPPERCADYLLSVMANGESRGLPAPQSFEEWIRWKLGDRIAEDYMLPYNRKVWGLEPFEMDVDWLHKIPRVNVREILLACLRRSADVSKMPSHSVFYYPREGGFQRVFDAIAAPIADRIECRSSVSLVEPHPQGGLVVEGKYRTKRVVNTAPWPGLADSPFFDKAERADMTRLRHSSLVVSLHEQKFSTDAHWCYEPSVELAHHRDFFIPNYAPHSAREGIMRETNLKRWAGESAGALGHFHNDYAYPIPSLGWAGSIDRVLKRAEASGIYGLGRWGQWQYFNSDVCIHEAMQLAVKLGHTQWQNSTNQ